MKIGLLPLSCPSDRIRKPDVGDVGRRILVQAPGLSCAVSTHLDLAIQSVMMPKTPGRSSRSLCVLTERVDEKAWRNVLDSERAPNQVISVVGTLAAPNVVRDRCLADKPGTELPG